MVADRRDGGGATKLRRKLAEAVALAKLDEPGNVDEVLRVAADPGRLADGDLAAILNHSGADVIEFPARANEAAVAARRKTSA